VNIQTIVNEAKRGCGYRKPGGLYLVSGQPSAPCGKLPLELTVCPCCGQGVKPARGWTWVDPVPLFLHVECRSDHGVRVQHDECENCPLDDYNVYQLGDVGLLWIGEKFYKTPEEFLAEGMEQGISRRISAIPNDFEIGKTWVLFAHRKVQGAFTTGEGYHYFPGIFGCFKPERIEYIVKDDDSEEKLERMEKRGITLVKLVRTDDGNGNGKLDLENDPEKDLEWFEHMEATYGEDADPEDQQVEEEIDRYQEEHTEFQMDLSL